MFSETREKLAKIWRELLPAALAFLFRRAESSSAEEQELLLILDSMLSLNSVQRYHSARTLLRTLNERQGVIISARLVRRLEQVGMFAVAEGDQTALLAVQIVLYNFVLIDEDGLVVYTKLDAHATKYGFDFDSLEFMIELLAKQGGELERKFAEAMREVKRGAAATRQTFETMRTTGTLPGLSDSVLDREFEGAVRGIVTALDGQPPPEPPRK